MEDYKFEEDPKNLPDWYPQNDPEFEKKIEDMWDLDQETGALNIEDKELNGNIQVSSRNRIGSYWIRLICTSEYINLGLPSTVRNLFYYRLATLS